MKHTNQTGPTSSVVHDVLTAAALTGVHRHQLTEHRLLLSERRERPAPEHTDRHLRLQLRDQPSHTQSSVSGQDLLR